MPNKQLLDYVMKLLRFLIPALLALSSPVFSQPVQAPLYGIEQGVQVRGTLDLPPGVNSHGLVVELSDPNRHMVLQRSPVGASGQFEFDEVVPAAYVVQVSSIAGVLITQEYVDLRQNVQELHMRIPPSDSAHPGVGTISVARLMHKVPGKAMKEFEQARKAIAKKDVDLAIEHYTKSVEIDPQFYEAQCDLGRCYLHKHDAEKALRTFQTVLKLDSRSEVGYAGSSISLLWMSQWKEAEHAARQALEINRSSAASRFFLGMSLAAQGKNDDEALDDLSRSQDGFPHAHIAESDILIRQGKLTEAAAHLNAYLKSGSGDYADAAREKLAIILKNVEHGSN